MAISQSRLYDFETDRDAGTKIQAARVDGELDQVITALNKKVLISGSAPSSPEDGQTWVDSSTNPPILKVYDTTAGAFREFLPIVNAAFENFISGSYIFRSSGTVIGCSKGAININGLVRRNTSSVTNTYSAPSNGNWLDVWALADVAASTGFTISSVDSGVAPGGSSNPGTNGRLIGSIKYINGTSQIAEWIQYRDGFIQGWSYIIGVADTFIVQTFIYGVTFSFTPVVHLSNIGTFSSNPTSPASFNSGEDSGDVMWTFSRDVTTTNFVCDIRVNNGNFNTARYYGYSFIIYGSYS